MVFICRYSCFSEIATSDKGSVLIIPKDSSSCYIQYCYFHNIKSLSSPACFYTEEIDIHIEHCTFSKCKAKKGDTNYGNAFYAYSLCKEV